MRYLNIALYLEHGCLRFTQEGEGSTLTRGTCPNDISDPIDQDICTQCALSWKKVVSEWRSVIAVSLNVGGGAHLIKIGKTVHVHVKHRTDTEQATVPYR